MLSLIVACLMISAAAAGDVVATGKVVCDGLPLGGVRVVLMDEDFVLHVQMGSARADDQGNFRVTGHASDPFGGKPDPYIKVQYDYDNGKMKVYDMGLANDKGTTRKNVAGTIHFGTIRFSSDQCKTYNHFRNAILDYRKRAGGGLPYSRLVVKSRNVISSTVGSPFATTDTIRIPFGGIKFQTAKHELAHTVRHTLDGSIWHFLADVRRYTYTQSHYIYDSTNLGFAFNEGWAEYWAGEGVTYTGTDYKIEGNVAGALRRLSDHPCHKGKGPAHFVAILRANPGAIHSFDEFKAKHDAMFPACVTTSTKPPTTTRMTSPGISFWTTS